MFPTLKKALGDIEFVCSNDEFSVIDRLFHSFSCGNSRDIITYFSVVRDSIQTDEQRTSASILLAAAYLACAGDRVSAVKIIQKLGPLRKEKLDEFLKDLIFNLWILLASYLSKPALDNEGFIRDNPTKTSMALMGDSHTIGLACSSLGLLKYQMYMPGLRLSLLSSPQENLKIVGVKNAFACCYHCDAVLMSLGEIDFRIDLMKVNSGRDECALAVENLISFMQPAFQRILELKQMHQRVFLICPPQPSDKLIKCDHDFAWEKYDELKSDKE